MADEAVHHHGESLLDLAKRHPAGTAIIGVGAVLILLRARAASMAGGSPIPVPVQTGTSPPVPSGGSVDNSGAISQLQQQTGQALGSIEQQIQALSGAANQHTQALGYQSPYPLNYNPGLGAYAGAGAVSGDLGYWTATSAQTLPDACAYGRCQGIFGCIGHFFTTTATCGFRAAQTVALGAGSLFSARFLGGLGAGGYGQVPGSVAGYPGYNGPLGGYGGYGFTPGIAPQSYGAIPVPPVGAPLVIPQAPEGTNYGWSYPVASQPQYQYA